MTRTKLTDWRRRKTEDLAEAHSLVDKILSCLCINFSIGQTLYLDGVETGILLSKFAQKLRLKNTDVPDIFSKLLDTAFFPGLLFWILMQSAGIKGETIFAIKTFLYQTNSSQRWYQENEGSY